MARRKGRAAPVARPQSRARHDYPSGWRPDDWLVPYIDGGACIHHGHTDPDDHSLCGPAIFCCRKAAARYVALLPDSCEAQATWELTAADHLLGWMRRGVRVLYFVFCDPERSDGLLAIGLSGADLPAILRRHIALERHAGAADRLI